MWEQDVVKVAWNYLKMVKNGKEWKTLDIVFVTESELDLRMIVECFGAV